MNSKTIFLIVGSAFLSTLLVFSCKKDNTLATETVAGQKEMNYLIENYGFQKEDLVIENNNIIAEGDIAFPINNFWDNYTLQDYNSGDKATPRKHYKQPNLISTGTKTRVITVNVAYNVPTAWANAIYDACTAWNGLNGKIKFSPQTGTQSSSGVINIQMGVLGSNVYAQGSAVTSTGNPGPLVTINSSGPSTNNAQKIYNMVHEIGHNIGFYHTDSGTGALISNVTNTCKNNSDASSVMRQGSQGWSGFSSCDIQAFNALYK